MHSAKKDLFDKIVRVYPRLSPKKRRVADLIIQDHKKVFLMTAKEIALACDVSEPTIIRFVNDLGFSGYAEFVQYMKGLLQIELTAVERLQKTSRQRGQSSTIQKYCRNAIENLENLMRSVSDPDLRRVARMIQRAPTVYVVGYRASATLAYYFGYILKKLREDVFVDIHLNWDLRDAIAQEGKSALLFVIAFPRYPRRTIELMQYARQYRVKIIGVSDTPKSPVVALSDHYVIIDLESVSFVDPFAHVIAYLGALLHEITFMDKDKATRCLSQFDDSARIGSEFFSISGGSGGGQSDPDSYFTALVPEKAPPRQ